MSQYRAVRGMVDILPDETDRRSRRLQLTDAGRAVMKQAVPIWREEHEKVDAELGDIDLEALKSALNRLGMGQQD